MGVRTPRYLGYKNYLTDNVAISVVTGPQMDVGISLDEHFDSGNKNNLYSNGLNRVDA